MPRLVGEGIVRVAGAQSLRKRLRLGGACGLGGRTGGGGAVTDLNRRGPGVVGT